MKEAVHVHPRISEKHPELAEEDVIAAWDSRIVSMSRVSGDPREVVAVGIDGRGRLVELVAKRKGGTVVIFHAFTPPTRKMLHELGLSDRR